MDRLKAMSGELEEAHTMCRQSPRMAQVLATSNILSSFYLRAARVGQL